jgi:hypothetical protein
VRHGREEGILGLIGAFGGGARGVLAVEQLVSLRGSLLLGRPVTHEVGVAAKLMSGTREGCQRAAHPDLAPVLADIPAVRLGASRGPRSVELSLSRCVVVGTEEAPEGQAEKFRFLIAEYALNADIPTHRSAIDIEQAYGVILQAIDEPLEPGFRFA